MIEITKYLADKKIVQVNFLKFLEDLENEEENFKNLTNKFEDMKIRDNKHDLRLFLHFISNICDNYCHNCTFFSKIERTLQLFKNDIKKYYSNSEIFNIFKDNKRTLLLLIKKGIMTVDKHVTKIITTNEYIKKYYLQYFAPEIKPFENEEWFPKDELSEDLKKELPDDFNELRDKGENDSFICKLIREDSVEDFIVYVNKNCISSNATINPSIYETNSFLLKMQIQSKKDLTLIEYAAFFGSIQIFTFLKNEKAKLKQSLWLYTIHSKNAELIHLLEELHIKQTAFNDDQLYKECFYESIKCHQNSIANYFINNYLQNKEEYSDDAFIQNFRYYNFSFLLNEKMKKSLFPMLCYFDYYSLVKALLDEKDIDINSKVAFNDIQNHIFQWNSKSYQ